ncbi:MAG: hypothetical protein U0401_27845 [Anaerolineae bacterium]
MMVGREVVSAWTTLTSAAKMLQIEQLHLANAKAGHHKLRG